LLYFYVYSVPGSDLAAQVASNAAFTTLNGSVCEQTLKGIADMGFTQMTEIQARTIPPLLEGRSVCIDRSVHFQASASPFGSVTCSGARQYIIVQLYVHVSLISMFICLKLVQFCICSVPNVGDNTILLNLNCIPL
jgi:hypothetical protein